jgi:hypothetical protein
MVLSVEAVIEIDFRMVDSLVALERNLQAEEFNAMSDLVEFRHLKYIVAVAEAATITRAAERLFLAQPSLSKQIKDFEDVLGFPIFVRTRQGVRITPAGQMIVAYAREALLKRTKIIAMARAVHRGEVPPFRLGFPVWVLGGTRGKVEVQIARSPRWRDGNGDLSGAYPSRAGALGLRRGTRAEVDRWSEWGMDGGAGSAITP